MSKITKFTMVFLICVLCIVGCRKSKSTGEKLYVVTTTGMITDLVTNIGGEHVTVDGLMGSGVDPHLYKVTASDTKKLFHAQLILYNGLHLEGKMGEILEQMGRKKPVVAVTDEIPKNLLREIREKSGIYDPHIWFDVSLWKYAAIKVEHALIAADPSHIKYYQSQGEAYRSQLEQLHQWVHAQIELIPKESRVLITAHDAFGYFGRAYSIEVEGLQGISTAASYGIKDVENLVNMLIKRKIRAVFVESSVPHKAIESVVEACKSQGHTVKIGGALFSDAMGAFNTEEGTYIGMVKYNVQTIVSALAGNPQ